MRFRIHYGNGAVYEGDPYEAPAQNVQVIVQEHPEQTRGSYLAHSRDYYLWLDNKMWIASDAAGYWDYMFQLGPRKVLFGRTMPSDADFLALISRAEKERLD